ncbi:MAG TPA: ABC transporter ATP-binding protein [Rhabdochlamydiaceae bacterium]|jgi:ABC-type polysaccharide/polyol phosphate transport system ATPase subunit|nr:ABC transporter ATP-binding protein [Rhabdochlamydiaceae bacterium]
MARIELEEVSLVYPIYGVNARSLKKSFINFAVGGRLSHEKGSIEVEALKEINLKLQNGDRLGIIGHNGAGKTSLLKVLAQIYEPTQGSVTINGQTNCLFDIMMGMDQELTGYENIMLRGLIMGLSKKEIKKIVPDVEAFAELGDFLKMPIKTYSSGMMVRLAFGIVTSISCDILLIDEVVNVGDASFMEKAKRRIADLIHRSDILVLSTHDHRTIKEFCNKALWLEKGQIKCFGQMDEVFKEHQACMVEVEPENAASRI